MKKSIFIALVLVGGVASVSVAQFSTVNSGSRSTSVHHANITLVDTLKKPVSDTLPQKTDSVPPKKDSTSFNF